MVRKLTLLEIQEQIANLQQQAEAARVAEKADVIARIKQAIPVYGITPQDLFGKATKPAGRKASGTVATKAKAKPGARMGRIKYRDDAGHTWSGYGRKPQWFLTALASGKPESELLA
ncbi:H-NS histone family protein [Burkholderia vietnamiensis]|uniref:H-NS histone family protein n=1 Tax=Burkholderia vietnamiensis TaxID=60552 RepID=UPI001D13C61F|nr:H-NS histone family protein [Burkholderia vietnamiensis]UEC01650.1 H-NS histone family protein [Burkholderia vietnamiensis]